jgi:hypothetical protein
MQALSAGPRHVAAPDHPLAAQAVMATLHPVETLTCPLPQPDTQKKPQVAGAAAAAAAAAAAGGRGSQVREAMRGA